MGLRGEIEVSSRERGRERERKGEGERWIERAKRRGRDRRERWELKRKRAEDRTIDLPLYRLSPSHDRAAPHRRSDARSMTRCCSWRRWSESMAASSHAANSGMFTYNRADVDFTSCSSFLQAPCYVYNTKNKCSQEK